MKKIALISAILALGSFSNAYSAPKENFSWIADSLKSLELLNLTVKDSLNAVATVRIGFSNPIGAFEISDVNASCLIDGAECFRAATVNIMAIEKKCDKTYLTDVNLSMPEGSNVFRILNILKQRYKPQMNLDASIKVAMRGGMGITVRRNIDMDGIFHTDSLCAQILGKSFSISHVPGEFSVRSFDVLYMDEIGTDGFHALLEIGLQAPSLMKVTPEIGLAGKIIFSGKDAFYIESVYKLDIKAGERMYYIPIKGKVLDGFNPCTLLKLLKSEDNGNLSIILSQPKIVGNREIPLYGD